MPYVPAGFRDWAGPHPFTKYLRGVCFVDHRFRLVPVRHTFQGTYREVKQGVEPYWVHAWIDNEFDLAWWLVAHPPRRV